MLTKDQLIKNNIDRLKNDPALQRFENANGFKIDITTLTAIRAKISEQKFYEVKISDFMPVAVGQHAFYDEILSYRALNVGGGFEAGIIQPGSNRQTLEKDEVQIEGVKVDILSWAKSIAYNLVELGRASASGNWNLVEAKEKARLKDWQLGLQSIAFLGSSNFSTKAYGLLNQSDVNINTTLIAKNISDMNATEFKAFLAGVLGAYFTNSNSTVLPDTFVIPTDDYLGLGAAVDETYGLKSRLDRIKEAFSSMTGNPGFKVLPLAYAMTERNSLGENRYVLYRSSDEDSLRMEIPIDYTTTIQDTIEGFYFNSAAYGQFTGAKAFRPDEMLYFDHSA